MKKKKYMVPEMEICQMMHSPILAALSTQTENPFDPPKPGPSYVGEGDGDDAGSKGHTGGFDFWD